jgi:hypothetical protein
MKTATYWRDGLFHWVNSIVWWPLTQVTYLNILTHVA